MSDMTEEDFKEIELSKPDIPKPNLKESIDAKAIIREKLRHAEELQLKYGKYESMEVSIGISDYWNIIVNKLDIIVKIVKYAPWIIDFMSKVVDIIQLFKGVSMKGKSWFWWITTIGGIISAIGVAWDAVAKGASWEQYVIAALLAIFGFLGDKVKKSVAMFLVAYFPYSRYFLGA